VSAVPSPSGLPKTAAAVLAGAFALLALHGGGFWTGHGAAQPAPPPSGPAPRQEAEQPAAVEQTAETPEDLPEGHGREDTFYRCTACHSTAVIRRSRLSRERWDELMDWMTERHGMPPLEGDERRVIVGYLAGAFPPQEQRRRGPANPFLTD
jgi:hypothetical protein